MKITQEDLAQFVPSLRLPGNKTLLHIGCGTASQSACRTALSQPNGRK